MEFLLLERYTIAEVGENGVLKMLDEYDAAAGRSLLEHMSAAVSWDDDGNMLYNSYGTVRSVGRLVAFRSLSFEVS